MVHGRVTRRRRKRLVYLPTRSAACTVTESGEDAPDSETLAAPLHEPLLFVARPFHKALFVIAYES